MSDFRDMRHTLLEYKRSSELLRSRLCELNRQLARDASDTHNLLRRRSLIYTELAEMSEKIREMEEYLAEKHAKTYIGYWKCLSDAAC